MWKFTQDQFEITNLPCCSEKWCRKIYYENSVFFFSNTIFMKSQLTISFWREFLSDSSREKKNEIVRFYAKLMLVKIAWGFSGLTVFPICRLSARSSIVFVSACVFSFSLFFWSLLNCWEALIVNGFALNFTRWRMFPDSVASVSRFYYSRPRGQIIECFSVFGALAALWIMIVIILKSLKNVSCV